MRTLPIALKNTPHASGSSGNLAPALLATMTPPDPGQVTLESVQRDNALLKEKDFRPDAIRYSTRGLTYLIMRECFSAYPQEDTNRLVRVMADYLERHDSDRESKQPDSRQRKVSEIYSVLIQSLLCHAYPQKRDEEPHFLSILNDDFITNRRIPDDSQLYELIDKAFLKCSASPQHEATPPHHFTFDLADALVTYLKTEAQKREETERRASNAALHDSLLRKGRSAVTRLGKGEHTAAREKQLLITILYCMLRHHLPECETAALSDLATMVIRHYADKDQNVTLINNLTALYQNKEENIDLIVLVHAIRKRGVPTTIEELKEIVGDATSPQKLQRYKLQQLVSCTDELIKHAKSGKGEFPMKLTMPAEETEARHDDVRLALARQRVQKYQSIKQAAKNVISDLPHVLLPSRFAGVTETPEYQQNQLDRAYLLKRCVSAALPSAHDAPQQQGNHELAERIISILSNMPDVDAEEYLWHSINEHVVRMQHRYSCETARHRLDMHKKTLVQQRAELEKDRQTLQKIRRSGAAHVDDSYARSCIRHGKQMIKECGRVVNDAAKVLNAAKKDLKEFNGMATGLNFEKIARSKAVDFSHTIGLAVKRASRMQKFSLPPQSGQLTELLLALVTFLQKAGAVASGGQMYAVTPDRAKTINHEANIREWMRYARATPSEMWKAWRAGLPSKSRVPEGGNAVIPQLNLNDELTFKREALHQLSRLSDNTSPEIYDEVAANLLQLADFYQGGSAANSAGSAQPQAGPTPAETEAGSAWSSAISSVREFLKPEPSNSAWPLHGASGSPSFRQIPCPEGTGRTVTEDCNPLMSFEELTRDIKLSLLAEAADNSSREILYKEWNCTEDEIQSLKILLCEQYHIYDEHVCSGQSLISWVANWKEWTWPSGSQPVGILRDIRPFADPKNINSGRFPADFPNSKNFFLTLKNRNGDTIFQKAYAPNSSMKEDIWHEDICAQINRDMQTLPESKRIKCRGISYESYNTHTPYISSNVACSSYRNLFVADTSSQVSDATWRFMSTEELPPQHRIDVAVNRIEKQLASGGINSSQNSNVRRQYILNLLSESLPEEILRCNDPVAVYNDADKSTTIMTLDRYLYANDWQSPSYRVSFFGHVNSELRAILSNPNLRLNYKSDKLTSWSEKESANYKTQLKNIGLTDEEIKKIKPREAVTLTFKGEKPGNELYVNKYTYDIEYFLEELNSDNNFNKFIGSFTDLTTTDAILNLKLKKYLLIRYPHLDQKKYVKEKIKKRSHRVINEMINSGEVINSHRLNQRMIDEIQKEIVDTSSPAHMEDHKIKQIISIMDSSEIKKESMSEKTVTKSVATVIANLELLSIYNESKNLQRHMRQKDFIDAGVIHTTSQGKKIISLIQYLTAPDIKDTEIIFPGPLDGGTAIYLQEARQKVQSSSIKTDALSKAALKWEDIKAFIKPVSNYADEKCRELIASTAPNAVNLSPYQTFTFQYMKPEYNGENVIGRKFLSKKFTLMEIYRGIKRQWESAHPLYEVYSQQRYQSVIDALNNADLENEYVNTLDDGDRRTKLVAYIDNLNVALRPENINAVYTFSNAPGLIVYAHSYNTPRTGDGVQENAYRILSLLTGQHLDFNSVAEMDLSLNNNETHRGFFLYHFPDGDEPTFDLSIANVYDPSKISDIRRLHNDNANIIDKITTRKKNEIDKFTRNHLETTYDAFVYGFQSVSYFPKAVNALIGMVSPPLGYIFGQLIDLPNKLSKFISSDNTYKENHLYNEIEKMLASFIPTISDSDAEGIGISLKMMKIPSTGESSSVFKLKEEVAEKINEVQKENFELKCLEAEIPSDTTTCVFSKGIDAKYTPVNNGVYKGTFFFNEKHHVFVDEKEMIPVIWSCADEGFMRSEGDGLKNIEISDYSKIYKIEDGKLIEYESENVDPEIAECPIQSRRLRKRSPLKLCYPSLKVKSNNIKMAIEDRYKTRKRYFDFPEEKPTVRQAEELRQYKVGYNKKINKIVDVDTDALSSIELKDLSTKKTDKYYDCNSEQFGEFVSLIEKKLKEEHISGQTKLIEKVYKRWVDEGYDVLPFPQNILILTGSSIANSGRCLPLSRLMALALEEGAENKFIEEVRRYSESPGTPEAIKFNKIIQDIHSNTFLKEFESVAYNVDSSNRYYSINEAFNYFRSIGTNKKYFFKFECTGGDKADSIYSGHTMLISYIPENNGDGGTYSFYEPNFGVVSTNSIIKIKKAVSDHLITRGLAEKYNVAFNLDGEPEFKLTEIFPRFYKDVVAESEKLIDVVWGRANKKDSATQSSYGDFIELYYDGSFSALNSERSTDIALDYAKKEYDPRIGASIYSYNGDSYVKSGGHYYKVTTQNGGATYRLKQSNSDTPGPELIYIKNKEVWLINNFFLAGGEVLSDSGIRNKIAELRYVEKATIDSYINKVMQKYSLKNTNSARRKIGDMVNNFNSFNNDKIELLQQVLGDEYISFEAEGSQKLLLCDYWFRKHPEGLLSSLDRLLSIKSRTKSDVLSFLKKKLIPYLKGKASSEKQNLKIYRGMNANEVSKILSWKDDNLSGFNDYLSTAEISDLNNEKILPIGKHLGDIEQAMTYGATRGYVLEFILKEGVEEKLFNPEIMALGKSKVKVKSNPLNKMSISKIGMSIMQEDPGADYHAASENEGTLAGYLGIKSENNNQFSIGVSEAEASKLLFSSLIKDIKITGYFTRGSGGDNKVFHKFTGESHTKADFENLVKSIGKSF